MGLLDSFKGDGELQREKELAVKKDEALDRKVDDIVEIYEEWFIESGTVLAYNSGDRMRADILLQDNAINQNIIKGFCMRLRDYQYEGGFRHSGYFISAMIQKAYEDGHNDFRIYTRHLEKRMDVIGSNIRGKKGDLLEVTIDGDAGQWCGEEIFHARFTFRGKAGYRCGFHARVSELIFDGRAGEYCGHGADYSRITFNDAISKGCGKCALGTFYSPREDVLKKIKKEASLGGYYYLIEPDGTHRPYSIRTKARDCIASKWRSPWES